MKRRFLSLAALLIAGLSTSWASVADQWSIPGPNPKVGFGAPMPYTRYDSETARLGGGAVLKTSATWDRNNIATQATKQSYVALPSSGAYAEWTMKDNADGVTLRFTMPDSSDGMGLNGSLDIYVNDVKVKTVDLTSYFMYQYFSGGHPSDSNDGGAPCFAFDETHFSLSKYMRAGDRIRVQSSGASGLEYGVDFIETEVIKEEISCPSGAVNVMDFGAVPNDGKDDLAAFEKALAAADNGSKVLYIPAGTWHLSGIWYIQGNGVKITGAGIWHTNIKFTNPNKFGGGISGGNGSHVRDGYCKNMEICNFYLNSSLRSRYNQEAVYKCFMDVFAEGSVIHDIWEEHFECGFWIADYNGQMDYSEGLKIINCRIRNNLADGVNFCKGTSNSVVYNCNIRNNGDDGLAMWNDTSKDEYGNIFCYNTIDLIWRAGGIAIYGGDAHKIYNNYIADMFMAAGIHLNTTFPGYMFGNTKNILFENNCLVRCGTNDDCWHEDFAAIDLKQSVNNVTFKNTYIYDSPFDAIRVLNGPSNISFDNTQIYGSGLSGGDITWSCVGHSSAAIRLQTQGVNFNKTIIANVKPDSKGNNSTWPIWTDNNAALAQSIGYELYDDVVYEIPEPAIQPNEPIVNLWETISNYNLKLEGVTYYNDTKTAIKEGDRVTLGCSIKNTSNVNIPANAKIAVNYVLDGKTYTYTHSDGLKAGETLNIYFDQKWTATPGGHTVTAIVDPENKADRETDENDNSRTKRFDVMESDDDPAYTPVSGGMDLQVLKVSYGQSTIAVGDKLVFSALVVNAGDRAVPAGTKIGLQFQVDGKTYANGHITWSDTCYDGLQPGETVLLTANGGGGADGSSANYWVAESGEHKVTAWVDDSNLFNEVNEDNNQTELTLNIPYNGIVHEQNPEFADDLENGGLIVFETPRPDDDIVTANLSLEALGWKNENNSASLNENDKVTFGVKIKNTSSNNIPAGMKVSVRIAVDGSSVLGTTYTDGIAAGQTVLITLPTQWTAVAGGHEITATLAPGNKLVDDNADDNSHTKKTNIIKSDNPFTPSGNYTPVTGGYDLYVTDIFYTPKEIGTGDAVTFSAVVVNAGDRDIPAGTVIGAQFQIDGSTDVITWSDNYSGGLKSHEYVTITACGGTNGSSWSATNGVHTVTAWVDDVNRLNGEVDENNNKTTISISIPYAGMSYFDNPDTPDNVFNTTDISIMQHRQYSTAVYDLSGRKVAESTEGLNAGIYIVGGKKIVVK